MASRYWVGGSGTWDTTNTANWSATSGGAGGASAPTSADAVYFNASSGAGTCTLGSDVVCGIIDTTGYTQTIDFSTFKIQIASSGTTILRISATTLFAGNKLFELTSSSSTGVRTLECSGNEANAPDISITAGSDAIGGGPKVRNLNFTGFSGSWRTNYPFIFGDLVLSPTMTISAGYNQIIFSSTSATTRNITTNGVVSQSEMHFDGVGGSWQLQDDLNIATSKILRTNNGTFYANNKNLTIGGFTAGSGTKTVSMGSGTWTLTGDDSTLTKVWRADFGAANLTVTPGTATINMTSASTKTFAGNAKTYGTLNQGGAGQLIIQQANTFANITNTVQPATITFPASTTTTVSALGVSGTSGNQITLNSSTVGTRATLFDASGAVNVSFCTIKDIAATGGAIWSSFTTNGNVNDGNNLGWDFNASLFRYIYTRRKNKRILPL